MSSNNFEIFFRHIHTFKHNSVRNEGRFNEESVAETIKLGYDELEWKTLAFSLLLLC